MWISTTTFALISFSYCYFAPSCHALHQVTPATGPNYRPLNSANQSSSCNVQIMPRGGSSDSEKRDTASNAMESLGKFIELGALVVGTVPVLKELVQSSGVYFSQITDQRVFRPHNKERNLDFANEVNFWLTCISFFASVTFAGFMNWSFFQLYQNQNTACMAILIPIAFSIVHIACLLRALRLFTHLEKQTRLWSLQPELAELAVWMGLVASPFVLAGLFISKVLLQNGLKHGIRMFTILWAYVVSLIQSSPADLLYAELQL